MLGTVPPADATRTVALLGPTNTGKTHKAVERMLEHETGMIGLPLRLLAREVYDKVSARIGQDRVALITGEEKRIVRRPDYWICTTEAMPIDREVDFLAVDEVQLATHDERGHVFTDRLLHARGRRESWFLGAATMGQVLSRVVPAAQPERQPRLSLLSFAGSSKLARLRPRSAVVAFSLKELYALAGRLCQLRGGTAVVLGALSPRARNAQVALFQAGEVEYLVATDAIGMGLNLDVEHVAFASLRKFDGQRSRDLEEAEVGQIAGRAGRWLQNGTFGTVLPLELDRDAALRVESHRFQPVRQLRYRNSDFDFSSTTALLASLKKPPAAPHLISMPITDDLRVLETLLGQGRLDPIPRQPAEIELLWRVCQIPDFRRLLFDAHVDLLQQVFELLKKGPLGNDFMAEKLSELRLLQGDADTLMARISRLRTWAFIANQSDFVGEAALWQAEFAALEDRLSDALHAALVARFVQQRTRSASSGRRQNHRPAPTPAEVLVSANHPFAALSALRARLINTAPQSPLRIATDLEALVDAPHEAFELDKFGNVLAKETQRVLGSLSRGASIAQPEIKLLKLEALGAGLRSRLERRLLAFGRDVVHRLLLEVRALSHSERAPLRAVGYQLEQGLGTALRKDLAASLDQLDPAAHEEIKRAGVELGQLTVQVPALLRSRALALRAALFAAYQPGVALPQPLGRPSYALGKLPAGGWRSIGYVALGPTALRGDLAERAAAAANHGPRELDRTLASLGVGRSERTRVARAIIDQSSLFSGDTRSEAARSSPSE